MGKYMLCNTEQLDSDLKSVADAIRAKGGTTNQLQWPDGYKTAVEAISTGTEVKRETGTLRITRGSGSVSFSFSPDVVYVTANGSDKGYLETAAAAFAEAGTNKINTMIWVGSYPADIYITKNNTQCSFEVISMKIANGQITEEQYSGSFTCKAVKYT